MTTYAYVTSIEAGTDDELIINKQYFANPAAAIANAVEDCESLSIKISQGELTVDALMDRIWHMKPILRSLGRVRHSVLGWTKDIKLVWVVVERIELQEGK